MSLGRIVKIVALVAIAFCSTISTQAAAWGDKGPASKLNTLIITGNYVKSRLLAELIQVSTRQPYMLVPAKGQPENTFFIPYKDKAICLKEYRIQRFINLANPPRIIVLGDARYVPERYLKLIDPKHSVIIVYGKNWEKIAQQVGKIMDLPNLADDFMDLAKLKDDEELYYPDRSVDGNDGNVGTAVQSNIAEPAVDHLPTYDQSPEPAVVVPAKK